ncbi:TPA: hypothetical protein ACIOW6_002009 [Streptococcus agalactiae]
MKNRKFNKVLLTVITAFTIVLLSACGRSMASDLQDGEWSVFSRDTTSENVIFHKNGNLELEDMSFEYQVKDNDKTFVLSRPGKYDLVYDVTEKNQDEYVMKLKKVNVYKGATGITTKQELEDSCQNMKFFK